MQSSDDSALLQQYLEGHSEAAFAALVTRHINLVYSVALRHVADPHLAEEITQAVFILLTKKAAELRHDKALSSWLFQATRLTASNVVRSETRRHRREQEAHMQSVLDESGDDVWRQITPLLDTAVASLSDTDRQAIVLRFYEGRNLREVGAALGASEDAAEKRVSRAVERLREFFAKRGLTFGASGLIVAISANAVQAAPVGLAVTISTAAALTGTTIITTATTTATHALAMTTLQKTLITATLAAAIGMGVFEARQAATLRSENQALQQRQAPLTGEIKQLQQERDDAVASQAALQQENERLQRAVAEVPKLRGEVARLRTAQQSSAQTKASRVDANDLATQKFLEAKSQAEQIARYLQQMPDKTIPELKLLRDVEWLIATKEAKFDTEADIRKTLSRLRSLAKDRMPMGSALNAFARENDGQLPTDLSQLKPYFKSALGDTSLDEASLDAIFERYKLLRTGKLSDFPQETWFIAEKAPVDKDYDSRAKFGNGRSTVIGTGLDSAGDPEDKSY